MVWIALLAGIVWVVSAYGEVVYRSIGGWKTGAEWEAFWLRFITSPAAAGTAALLAAIIAAISFAKGLNHTKTEAQANRWWEQFEWVTDRIVPKDPKQERLHNGLATSLLGALEATAGDEFQREAVDGIRHTYIRGTAIPLSTATPGELRAQLREVRTFAEASWISGDKFLQSHFRTYVYLLETVMAVRTAWKPEDIRIPAEQRPGTPQFKVHALVRLGRHTVVVNATSRPAQDVGRYAMESLDRLSEHMKEVKAEFFVVVALNPFEDRIGQAALNHDRRMRVIYWDPKEGAAELRKRMELHIGPDGLTSRLLANEELMAEPG